MTMVGENGVSCKLLATRYELKLLCKSLDTLFMIPSPQFSDAQLFACHPAESIFEYTPQRAVEIAACRAEKHASREKFQRRMSLLRASRDEP